MEAYFFLVLICLLTVTVIGSALTDMGNECNMAGFYAELGCTAVPGAADNSTVCPDAYTCPKLHPDPSMCYYRGVPYKDRSTIPQAEVKNPCSLACQCSVSGKPSFDCAAVDCVETFDDMQQECIKTYDLESCCSTGTVCGKDAVAALKTCEVDGKTYREGEAFEPKNSRKTCICTAQWNGTIDDSASCRDINCGLEIHYQDKLCQNCAPIFLGSDSVCPIAFTCPTNRSIVIRGLNLRGVSSQCVFWNMTLSVGDEVTVDEECTKCTCNVPPFVSCTKKIACNE
ncbi:uncharacterized protein LOC106712874 isoform X1 [Papilio machaon]|uniref:uncharacterized protein LOC106712874 isoform X1 n=1 Tax=Papilio machaon TaxID=76193 RepID=UPI001E66458A|nr:uncharacterized protein LOC106712874 isoform X1 [Papilio machaon]